MADPTPPPKANPAQSSDQFSASVLIVDDHNAVRAGLRNLVSWRKGWFIAGEAADGEQAVELALKLKPSLIVMDISMPRMDGLEATRRIREKMPHAEIVIVSQHDSEQVVAEAQRAGARGFVVKSHLSADLLPALEAALLHSSRVSAPVSKAWQDAVAKTHPADKRTFPDPGPHDDLDLMSGGGDMGALMRSRDWSKTAFGPVSEWPQSLRTALRICLDSRFPILIWWGPELRLLYNDAYRPALGSTKHPHSLGAPGREIWADIWDTIGPMLETVMRTGQASWENDQLLLFDRHGYVEESYWTYSYSAIRLSSGEVGGVFSAVHEVTDRVLTARRLKTLREVADQAVQAKNERDACELAMQSIVRNPADFPWAIIFLCQETNCTRVAASFDAGPHVPSVIDLTQEDAWGVKAAAETRSAHVFDVQDPESLPCAPYGDRCKKAVTIPILGVRRETIALLTIGVSPYCALEGGYLEFFESLAKNLAANINNARAYAEERKRSEALAELDRAKTVFFSNVSHEFRTPLTLMLGPLEDSLSAKEGLPAEQRERLEVAHRNSVRLLRLVNTLLDFSRIEAGRIQASFQETDLGPMTSDLASQFQSATDRAGLELVVRCPPTSQAVYVDREMWEKIVFNLLSNAFKFTFQGQIEVTLRERKGAVELSVCDTGTGIPPQEMPHLFERFYRVKGAQGRTFEGSGIGLSLVQELVKLHGGTVTVKSELKHGSTFTVTIPTGKDHLPADRIDAARTTESTGLRGEAYVQEALRWLPRDNDATDEIQVSTLLSPADVLPDQYAGEAKRFRVLLADDNADMREYVQKLLRQHYDVLAVPDGESALKSAREHRPDLILSDVMMPKLDGFGLLHALRSDEVLKRVPVILLSARAGEESRIEGLKSGADDYLIKPFSARELLARVRTHIELSRLRQESEQALARRTAQFQTLLNEAPLGVYLVDAEFRIREVNPRALRAFGNDPGVIGQNFEEVIRKLAPQDYADTIVSEFRHTLATGESRNIAEHIGRRSDLGFGVYEWQINRIVLPDGQFGVVCYFRDISQQVQAREALAENAERLRLATEAAGLGLWQWYPEQDRAVWENDRMYTIYGRTREDGPLNLSAFEQSVDSQDLAKFKVSVQHALETHSKFSAQARIYRKDGTQRWVEFTGKLEQAKDGAPARMLGTALDITERTQAQDALQVAHDRLQTMIESITDGLVVMDREWRFTYVSKTAGTILGMRFEDLVGRVVWDVFPAAKNTKFFELYHKAVETGKPQYFEEFYPEPLNQWLECRCYPSDEGVTVYFHDVTARKKVEESLRQQRERFEMVTQASQVGFWFCDLPFDKLIWDERVKEHFWLAPDAEVSIDTFYERLHPDDREPTRLAMETSIANDKRYDVEYRTVAPDGREKWVRAIGRTFYDSKHQPKTFDGVTFDITEKKIAQDRERRITAEAVAAQAKFRAVFEQTPVFAGIMNNQGVLVEANKLCLEACGYRAEEVLGKHFWDTGWWRNFPESQNKIKAATSLAVEGEPYREMLRYSWADGTERLMEFALDPILDDQGHVLFLHPTGIDITDLKLAEEKSRKLAETLEAQVRSRTLELEERNADVLRQSEQLRELSWRLLRAQDDERRHIARELHDSAGQTLTILGINLAQLVQKAGRNAPEVATDAEMIQETVQQLHREIRTTSYLLHPPLLDESGLSSALEWYTQGLMERSGLQVTLEISRTFGRLPRDMELVIFRLVQECLTNIHRHSGSKTAFIRIERNTDHSSDVVDLQINDHGKGMSRERLAAIQSRGSGVGIRGMRERLRQFEGKMTIESDGSGTRISVRIPVPSEAKAPGEPLQAAV